eukprot:scaffold152751_cov39-Tisochrysis_lutea.AAC.1
MRFSALVLWLPLAWANPPSWYAIVQPRLFQHSVRAPQRTALSQSSYPDDPQFPQAERCVAASASSGLALSRVPALGGGLATAAICVVAMIVTIQTIQPGAVPASMESTRRLLQEWASIRALNPQTAAFLAAFGMYAASDAMGQCVTAWRQADKDGDVTRLDVKRMLRSAACSGLLSGWFAVIYFGILDHFVRLPAWAAEIDGHLGAFLACLPVIVKVAVDVGLYEPLYDTAQLALYLAEGALRVVQGAVLLGHR